MKVWIKNLRGDEFDLDVEADELVHSLKEKIQKLHGHDTSLQKLVYLGKIMEDQKTVAEYGVKEADKLVIMISKPKPQPKGQTHPSENLPSHPSPAQINRQPEVPSPHPQPGSYLPQQPSPLATGSENEQMINMICEMGFPRADVMAAMRVAYNNPDRAIEYLTGGLIAENEQFIPEDEGDMELEDEGAEDNPLAFLYGNPMFVQLRDVIQQNPEILPGLLQQLQQTNPELAELIMQNQDEFLRMINEPLDEEGEGDMEGIDPALIQGLPQPPANLRLGDTISLTEQELDDIKRLQDLGFSQRDALEAYLICDKNENMAANLLFENYQPAGLDELDLLAQQEARRKEGEDRDE
jgi:UV excision repair protein RAD23